MRLEDRHGPRVAIPRRATWEDTPDAVVEPEKTEVTELTNKDGILGPQHSQLVDRRIDGAPGREDVAEENATAAAYEATEGNSVQRQLAPKTSRLCGKAACLAPSGAADR